MFTACVALADRAQCTQSAEVTRLPTGQQRAHEGPFVPEHASTLVPDAVGFGEVRICAEQGTVLLIGGEAGEAEQGQGFVARPLGGQEIAMVRATVQIDQLDPPAAEAFKSVDLRGIDHVLNDAGDHASP